MEIKNIKKVWIEGKGYFKILYKDLEANIFDDGREFCAISFDGKWCCKGIVVAYEKNLKNKNPLLQVTDVFKKAKAEERSSSHK